MKNTGKPSEKQFEEIFAKLGKKVYIDRLVDTSEVRGRLKKKDVWVREQPCDYLVTENGRTYRAEVKSTVDPKVFKTSMLKTHQKASAKRTHAAGGTYFVFIHSIAHDRWYKVPANVLLSYSKASVPWDYLRPYSWSLAYA